MVQNELPALPIVPVPGQVHREGWEATLRAQAWRSERPSPVLLALQHLPVHLNLAPGDER